MGQELWQQRKALILSRGWVNRDSISCLDKKTQEHRHTCCREPVSFLAAFSQQTNFNIRALRIVLPQATDLVTLEEVKNFLNSSIVGQALHSDHGARLGRDTAKIGSCREVAKTIRRTWGAKGRERTVNRQEHTTWSIYSKTHYLRSWCSYPSMRYLS